MAIGNQDANVDTWQALVNLLLDQSPLVQNLFNTVLQGVHTLVDRKYWPILAKGLVIPNFMAPNEAYVVKDVLQEVIREWMRPNLGGIVIQATIETQSRDIDVSENMIIVQGAGLNKTYNTDNSAPHPRTWHLQGYLSSAIPYVDEHFVLRPSLIFQQALLDAYSTSRRPIYFRSGLCVLPTQVLIENYTLGREVQGNNAVSISINLREFVTYKTPFYVQDGGDYSEPSTGTEQAQQGSTLL